MLIGMSLFSIVIDKLNCFINKLIGILNVELIYLCVDKNTLSSLYVLHINPDIRDKTGMNLGKSILQTIGNTPVVMLNGRYTKGINVFLKMENINPGGSIKDRIAVAMLERAEAQGELRPGMVVIEPSSGNTAIGLAMACAVKGYRFIAVLDRMVPAAKRDNIKAFGAEIIFLPEFEAGTDTVKYRIDLTKEIIKAYPNAFSPMQFENQVNPDEHYRSTGRELYETFGNNLTACFATAGSCGTLTGISRYLKEKNPQIQIYGVEPEGSIIFGGESGKYLVQGAGLTFIPSILDRTNIDITLKVTDIDAFRVARKLARNEGILIGGTGGCAVSAALNRLDDFKPGDNIVVIIPDSGERYIDTIYNDTWLFENNFSELVEESKTEPQLEEIITNMGCVLNEF
ncbi:MULTISPECIES: PLP-dependent cysteine synthase family protein [Photorhabdus]|uniref:PLP-dependent cysteine synthase family protein n=1 Tax=Photorhabdus TaxID=29487 RepID=UPI001EFDCCE8|nr:MULTISPECIES: cysteine synthase family protein [Photorhabdus]MCT8342518.1 cysteine synthase family protein [Photorhabdus kleinii]